MHLVGQTTSQRLRRSPLSGFFSLSLSFFHPKHYGRSLLSQVFSLSPCFFFHPKDYAFSTFFSLSISIFPFKASKSNCTWLARRCSFNIYIFLSFFNFILLLLFYFFNYFFQFYLVNKFLNATQKYFYFLFFFFNFLFFFIDKIWFLNYKKKFPTNKTNFVRNSTPLIDYYNSLNFINLNLSFKTL